MCRPEPRRVGHGRLLPTALALLLVAGCDEAVPPAFDSSPELAALALFDLRVGDDGVAAPWSRLFEGATDGSNVELLEALEAIPPIEAAQVTRVELDGEAREAYVDIDARLPGGGTATFSARLRAPTEGAWRIVWFQGPEMEWPKHAAKGDGLSQSAPPDSPTR